MTKSISGTLKVARTFIENQPEQFGIYAPRVPGGPFNGELLGLCREEQNANLFAAAPAMLGYLKTICENGGRFESMSDYTEASKLIGRLEGR